MWTPILDCPIGSGTLELLPRSHKNGVRPFRPSAQNGGLETICGPDEEWVTGDMRPGDLLIFGCLTVHRGAPNISRTLRLSVDFRFQPLSEPACANGFESGSDAENWDTIYSRWTTDSLKYYWRALDPTLVPFDDSYANTRDAQAIALGEAGDATALAGLRRAAGTSRSASVRRKASELLRALTAFDRDPK